MMFLSISAVLALLHGQADAVELDLGTRFPAMSNEEIVVRNDGGVRNETHSFAFWGNLPFRPGSKNMVHR
jgi:hypothetical protein